MSSITVTIPNTDTQKDLLTWSMAKDTMRKIPCLDDEAVGGMCVSSPCSPCENDTTFKYYLTPGDFIPLQFRFPDTVNEEPSAPTLGWRNGSGEYWLEVQLIALDGSLLYEGNIQNIASSAYVASSEEMGNYQVVILSADMIIDVIGSVPCFVVRTRVRIRSNGGFSQVLAMGVWDFLSSSPTAPIGARVMNNIAGSPGVYERTATGWELVGMPQTGDLVYVEEDGQMYEYTAGNTMIFTAHGDAGAGNFSFSRCILGSPFEETDTIPVDDGVGTAPTGGIVLGLRRNPYDPTKGVASIRTVRRWAGVQTSDSAESGYAKSSNMATWLRTTLDDEGPFLPSDARSTRISWTKDDPGAVVMFSQGYTANGVQALFYRSSNYGLTWNTSSGTLPLGQEASSLTAYGYAGEWCVGAKSGRLYYSPDGGATWDFAEVPGLGNSPIVGRLNADTVIAVGEFTGKYTTNTNRGDNTVAWSALQSFPDIGRQWRCTDILTQGSKVWVFGVDNEETPNGVLFRSTDNGATWTHLPAGDVLGGRAAVIGLNTLVATSYIVNEVGSAPLRAGQVYMSTNGGSSWSLLGEQPSGGAEAIDGVILAGSWAPVEFDPGEIQDQFDSCDTYPFRLVPCGIPSVKFEGDFRKMDCLGYYHGTDADFVLPAFEHEPQSFYHEFRLYGSMELDELQVERELSENGVFLRSTGMDRYRVRLSGMPEKVAKRVQAVLQAPSFLVNGLPFDTVDTIRKNNDEGAHWWMDFRLSSEGCETEGSCE